MNKFDEVKDKAKKFVRENKDFFDMYSQNIDNLTIGNYFDLYIGSKGITGLYTGEDFDREYDNALTTFYDQDRSSEIEDLIIGYLDFLIWLKKQQEIYKVKIAERRRLFKHVLEFPHTINHIYANEGLAERNKFEILLFYYCSLQEIFKNVIPKGLLLKIWKQGKTDNRDLSKGYLQLGDFTSIIDKYKSQLNIKNDISNIFDVELRNKILHADYLIESDKIEYGTKSLSKQKILNRITRLAITLQFFVLFYLRLFEKND